MSLRTKSVAGAAVVLLASAGAALCPSAAVRAQPRLPRAGVVLPPDNPLVFNGAIEQDFSADCTVDHMRYHGDVNLAHEAEVILRCNGAPAPIYAWIPDVQAEQLAIALWQMNRTVSWRAYHHVGDRQYTVLWIGS